MIKIKKKTLIIFSLISIFLTTIYLSYKRDVDYKSTLKVMTEEDYEGFSPHDPIDKQAYQKSLFQSNLEYKMRYFEIQALYRKGIDIYLDDKMGLTNLDQDIISNSKMIGIDKGREDLYKKYSTLNTTYVYLRNYIHVERLNDEELEFLYRRVVTYNEEVDEELYQLVEKTYKKVLPFNDDVSGKVLLTEASTGSHSTTGPYAKVNINSIVIMISADIIDIHRFWENKDHLDQYYLAIEWNESIEEITIVLLGGSAYKNKY